MPILSCLISGGGLPIATGGKADTFGAAYGFIITPGGGPTLLLYDMLFGGIGGFIKGG